MHTAPTDMPAIWPLERGGWLAATLSVGDGVAEVVVIEVPVVVVVMVVVVMVVV